MNSCDTAKVWEAKPGVEIASLEGHADRVLSASFSPDGKKLVTADGDGSAKIWDAAALARRVWIVDQGAEATSVAFSPDGKWIVSGSANGTVSLWDTVNRE